MPLLLCFVHPHSWMPQVVYRQGRSSSHEPLHFLVFYSKLFAFFIDMYLQRKLSSSVVPRWFLFVCWQKLCMGLQFALHYTRIIVRHLRSPMIFGEKWKLCFFLLHLPVTCLRRGLEYFIRHPQPLFFHQEVRERARFTRAQNNRSKCNFVSLRFLDTPDDKMM